MRLSASFFILVGLLVLALLFIAGIILKPNVIPKLATSNSKVLSDESSASNPLLAQSVKGIETSTQGELVKQVIDGDTIILANGEKVRLIGINAPEVGQPFYESAKEMLERLLQGRSVKLETDVEKNDSYKRTLAYVYVGDTFVNLEMVKSGRAVVETISPNVAHAQEFVAAQKSARDSCSGIWEGLCAQKTSACVQISSIHANAKGNDNVVKNDEWVELVNTCSSAQNLKGYLIKDSSASNAYTFSDLTLGSKAKVKLHSGCSTNTYTDIYWQCPERPYAVWNNSGDHAYLYDPTGKLVSDMGY